MINGNKIRNPFYIHQEEKKIWADLRGTGYCISKHHHFHRDDHEKICEAFNHISYLAKARGKGYKPHHTKNAGAPSLMEKYQTQAQPKTQTYQTLPIALL
jgi:hypothetical protein